MYSVELKRFIEISKNYQNINYVPEYRKYWRHLLISETSFLKEASNAERFWFLKNNTKERPVCIECGNRVNFAQNLLDFSRFCSQTCAQSSVITREKLESTNLEKYGHRIAGGYGTEEHKKGMIKKHGGTTSTTSPKIIVKTKLRFISKARERMKDQVIPNFSDVLYVSARHIHNWKCVSCGMDFDDSMSNGQIPRCPICFPILSGFSNAEKELVGFIKSIYSGEILENSREIISPLELDVYLPDEKLAIEYNGLYWHSNLHKDDNYHLSKLEHCEKLGIRLISIFEDEWISKKEIVKSILQKILGENTWIFSENCMVREIDANLSESFLDENHILGNSESSIGYGLFSKGLLVAVMTFMKLELDQWVLLRYSSQKDLSVIGGAKKCFFLFLHEHNHESVIYYSDKRWELEEIDLGFTRLADLPPDYSYFKENNKRYSRDILQDFQEYLKIFDCGNKVFLYPNSIAQLPESIMLPTS